MSLIKKQPYFLPKSERMKVKAWNLIKDGDLLPLDQLFPDWDAAMPVHVSVTVEADLLAVLQDCQLSLDSKLRLATTWHSPKTGLRGRGNFIDLTSLSTPPWTLELKVDGTELAQSIVVRVALVLINPGSESGQLAPKRPGSRLWSEERTILLEGETARFPVELIDFSKSSWLPEYAAWFLDWNPDDFEQTLLGDIRLYINSKHDRVKAAVSGQNKSESALREIIYFDVARAMIIAALKNDEFIRNPRQYQDDTIGAAIRRLIQIHFPNDSFISLRSAYKEYPNRFECQLQHALRLFWKE